MQCTRGRAHWGATFAPRFTRPAAGNGGGGAAFNGGPATGLPARTEDRSMLMTIAFVLIVLWLLGLVSSYTMGGLIHILLVVAIIVFLVQFIQGRRRA